jgi:hypothetical protein
MIAYDLWKDFLVTKRRWFNLALRAFMETGIVFAFAYWGHQLGKNTGMKILLSINASLIGFGFWGAIVFHQAGNMAEPIRLIEELIISWLHLPCIWLDYIQLAGRSACYQSSIMRFLKN